MDAQQIIEYIRTSKKKTPVKVYVWEKNPVTFPAVRNFSAAPAARSSLVTGQISHPYWKATNLSM